MEEDQSCATMGEYMLWYASRDQSPLWGIGITESCAGKNKVDLCCIRRVRHSWLCDCLLDSSGVPARYLRL